MSDWGATHSTVKSVLAGFDQEMPGGSLLGAALKAAVEKGDVPLARLNDMVHRILRTEFALRRSGRTTRRKCPRQPFHRRRRGPARRRAERSCCLKNADGQLPLEASGTASIAVIGSHADAGVLSGGGSDQVDPAGGNAVPGDPRRLAPFLAAAGHPRQGAACQGAVRSRHGLRCGGQAGRRRPPSPSCSSISTPPKAAMCRTCLCPTSRTSWSRQVAAANPHTIVVLETGGPVTMPWIDNVSACLEAWYPGIRGGEAIARILFGDVNPSAKLPVTFPKSEADLPEVKLPGSPHDLCKHALLTSTTPKG